MSARPEELSILDSTEELKFFVNEEEVVYLYEKSPGQRGFVLSVKEILTSAGFVPADDYRLTRDSDGHQYNLLEDEVRVRPGEGFTATYKGTTPFS